MVSCQICFIFLEVEGGKVFAWAEKGALVGSNVLVFRLCGGRVLCEIVHGDALC